MKTETCLTTSEKIFDVFTGQAVVMQNFALWKLLPTNAGYITYEGSMTTPGCQETVTWILLNQPLHISVRTVCRFQYLFHYFNPKINFLA